MLHDREYVNQVKLLISESKEKYKHLEDKGLCWDTVKCEIRGLSIRFSKRKAFKERENICLLKEKIATLTEALQRNATAEIIQKLEEAKKELNDINDKQTRASMLRSKAKWTELGEKSSKYFLGLEKRNFKNKCITKLRTEHETTTNPKQILQIEKSFYSTLYSAKGTSHTDYFLDSTEIPQLNDTQWQACEGKLSQTECSKALRAFQNNKSPGSDGFTAEFYKFFWGDINKMVLESLNYGFRTDKLSIDQRRGIISLIPKKDKDRTLIKNWRPITLLNIDYKIGAKALALRIQPLLPHLINEDQTGYIKNRYIGENILLISDILFLTKLRNEPGLLLLIDFEKAFDSVEWDFMHKTLAAFNFGDDFKKWIKVFYTDSSSCVTNNGFASDFFTLSRSVRQGCPLAPYLFILAVETLAIAIRDNKKIKGINVNGTTCKISQLADDTTCFLSDIASAKELLIVLSKFGCASGLNCNRNKTVARWMGSKSGQPPGDLPLTWTVDEFSTLGILFMDNYTQMSKMNYDSKIKSMCSLLRVWRMRDLSLIGKIIVSKSLGISKLLYIASMVHTPDNIYKEVQRIINEFVWSKKPPKVRTEVLVNNIPDGGLKMVNFEFQVNSLLLSWVCRFYNETRSKWKKTLNSYFDNYDVNLLFLAHRGKAQMSLCHGVASVVVRPSSVRPSSVHN